MDKFKEKTIKDYTAWDINCPYRGIKVCNEWQKFENFINWAYANGYEKKDKIDRRNVLSIERIDVNGNYEPNNCKWIPFSEQGKNKRYSGKQGVEEN